MRKVELGCLGLVLVLAGCGSMDPPDDAVVIEGVWTGELQTGFLPSGSSAFIVDVERAEIGEPVVASVIFGEDAAPAEPTDPEVGWPMGVDPQLEGTLPVADGFVYSSLDGTRSGDRISVELAVTELWAPWCALQTPHLIAGSSDEAQCLPNAPWSVSPFECYLEGEDEEADVLVDCLKLTLCRRTRVCECTVAEGCSPSSTGLTMRLELTVDGDTATGTIFWISEDLDVGTQMARVSFTRS